MSSLLGDYLFTISVTWHVTQTQGRKGALYKLHNASGGTKIREQVFVICVILEGLEFGCALSMTSLYLSSIHTILLVDADFTRYAC